jgi:4'-phosphopantetheinyl transferase
VSGGRVVVCWSVLGEGDETLLSGNELARASRFRDGEDRRRFVAGRAWLRSELAALGGGPAACQRFGYGPMGKPHLVDDPGLHFSLSHTEDLVVLAAGRSGPVGLDAERARPGVYEREAAALVLAAEEIASIEAADDPDAAFVAAWTRKEAYAKLEGEGLERTLAGFSLEGRGPVVHRGITVESVELGLAGVACAVATRNGERVELRGRS